MRRETRLLLLSHFQRDFLYPDAIFFSPPWNPEKVSPPLSLSPLFLLILSSLALSVSVSLCLLTAAAIHTGPPRNVPIPVAGQHYRTTEASNGSLAEQTAIGRLFGGEGLLQRCMTT